MKGVSRVDNAITEVAGGESKRKVGCDWMMGQSETATRRRDTRAIR